MRGLRIVGAVLLVWNLMGLAAFGMQVSTDPAKLGDPVTARAFASMPAWVWAAYGLAVLAGTGGAIALLMRRRAAPVLFALSTLCMILQFAWTFLVFDLLAYKNGDAALFPGILIAIGLFATVYAYRADRRGALA